MSLHKSLNTQASKVLLYKHLLSKISQNLKTKQSGFTLIELLVAMVILTIVVGMTGTGLVFVMSKNTSSDGEITQQTNLRRALDFIGDEVRSASLVSQTPPTIPAWGFTPPSSSILYLEIPTPVDSVSSATLTVPNHGLAKGNAVRISGSNLASASPSSVNSNDTYYVSGTYLPTSESDKINTLQLVKNDGTSITFNSLPQNFSIRRLVFYYTAYNSSIADSGWKGEQVLFRGTGNCGSASSASPVANPDNCLVMVDSLRLPLVPPLPARPEAEKNLPVFIDVVGGKQATIYLNGKLCNPPTPTLANGCTTGVTNVSVSMTAISRATPQ